jgi:hypothetical protein
VNGKVGKRPLPRNLKRFVSVNGEQGDQIGRIFAYWAIVYYKYKNI